MNWRYKALLQLAFSNLPYGERLNYVFQRYITRSLPNSDAKFASIVTSAEEHIDVCRNYLGSQLVEATFYEFGVGWDMLIPLTFYSFGVDRQVLVDIRPLLRPKLVNDTVEKFQRLDLDVELLRKPDKYINGGHRSLQTSLKEYYAIEYRAPCDAGQTGLEKSSIDAITSTNTLEHIPPGDIKAILRECHRLLRDEGLMSFRIDYQDHYSYFDRSISAYNFLRYSDRTWALFSPALHYQNRLRHRDYLELFEAAGFEVVEERRTNGTVADLETIERIPLDKRFLEYSPQDLAIRGALVVLRKRYPANSLPTSVA